MSEPLKKVKSISEMDTETLLKHMNARHVPVAGISHFGKSNVPGDKAENLLRAMHEHVHEHPLYKDTISQTTHYHEDTA